MIGKDNEMKSRDDSVVNVFVERSQCFWKMKDVTLESVVAAAQDHEELAKYFQREWGHMISDGGLAANVKRLLEMYKKNHPDEVAEKAPADGGGR